MTISRLPDHIDHMLEAATQACAYVEGQTALPNLIEQLPAIRKKLIGE